MSILSMWISVQVTDNFAVDFLLLFTLCLQLTQQFERSWSPYQCPWNYKWIFKRHIFTLDQQPISSIWQQFDSNSFKYLSQGLEERIYLVLVSCCIKCDTIPLQIHLNATYPFPSKFPVQICTGKPISTGLNVIARHTDARPFHRELSWNAEVS